jgi:Uma2 family endonuclease
MNTLHEIIRAIERLPTVKRRDLEMWIREMANVQDGVSEALPSYAATQQSRYLSVEKYLKFEEMSTTRHEYIGGELFAMTGATQRHNVICLNVASAFLAHLRGGPCRAYVESVKVRFTVKRDEILYYPDVLVACGPQDLDEVFLTDPKLIVEVLSPSTARVDRREKALNYREIPTFEEYVLIDQRQSEVTVYRRSDDWRPQVLTQPDAEAQLRSIAFTLPLGRIYDGILFD